MAAGEHGHTEHDLYYVRRWHLTRELAEALAIQIANATFAARQRWIWGEGSTAVSSDSTHFGAWDQNIFTECGCAQIVQFCAPGYCLTSAPNFRSYRELLYSYSARSR